MNILLSGSQGGQNIQIENYEAEHVAGAGGEQRLLLLQGLFWLVKCPHNEEIRANTGNGQHRWSLNVSPARLIYWLGSAVISDLLLIITWCGGSGSWQPGWRLWQICRLGGERESAKCPHRPRVTQSVQWGQTFVPSSPALQLSGQTLSVSTRYCSSQSKHCGNLTSSWPPPDLLLTSSHPPSLTSLTSAT